MKVYFVRHGISADHEEKKSQGPDSKLSETGRRQAEKAAVALSEINFDKILASNWARAAQTAQIIGEKLNKEVELIEGIHEREKDSSLEGIKHKSDDFEKFWSEFKKHGHKMDWKYGRGGESLTELVERSQKFKLHLIKHHKNEDVLVVSHSLFIRAFVISTLLGNNLQEDSFVKLFNSISTDNTGITLMEYSAGREHWELRFLNDHSHLKRTSDVHQMKLNTDPFKKVKSGSKTIEIRLFDEKRQELKIGDKIIFTNTETSEDISTEIIDLYKSNSFIDLFSKISSKDAGWNKDDTPEKMANDMRKYYPKEDEEKYGVLGIKIKLT